MTIRHLAQAVGLLALLSVSGEAAAQPVPPGSGKEPPLGAQQEARLKERERARKKLTELRQAGKPGEAAALWAKELDHDRKVFGRFHEVVAETAGVLAELHELREDFPAARQARLEVLAIRTRRYGK